MASMRLRFLVDVPASGIRAGDELELPRPVAQAMLERGQAKPVAPAPARIVEPQARRNRRAKP